MFVVVDAAGAPFRSNHFVRKRDLVKISAFICLKEQKRRVVAHNGNVRIGKTDADSNALFVRIFIPNGVDLCQSQVCFMSVLHHVSQVNAAYLYHNFLLRSARLAPDEYLLPED